MRPNRLKWSYHTTSTRKETSSLMNTSITQDMKCRQSLMQYAEKYGVSRASRKYNRCRSYINAAKVKAAPRPPQNGQPMQPYAALAAIQP